jgi:hypothetical protein
MSPPHRMHDEEVCGVARWILFSIESKSPSLFCLLHAGACSTLDPTSTSDPAPKPELSDPELCEQIIIAGVREKLPSPRSMAS